MHPDTTKFYRALYYNEKKQKGNARDLARIFGISERTAQRWNREGIPEKGSKYTPESMLKAIDMYEQYGVMPRQTKKKQKSLVDIQLQKEKQTLSTKQLAKKYGVSERTMQRWLKDGIPIGVKGTKFKGPSRRAPAVKRPYQPKIIHGVAHFIMRKFDKTEGKGWYESTKLLVDTPGNRWRTELALDSLIATEMNKGLYEGDIELLEHGIEPVNVTLSTEVLDTVIRRG